jgi:hypothetical protein
MTERLAVGAARAASCCPDLDPQALRLLVSRLTAERWLQPALEAVAASGLSDACARHFGGPPVPPLTSVHDAVATWPEFAICVAVRAAGHVEVCAP